MFKSVTSFKSGEIIKVCSPDNIDNISNIKNPIWAYPNHDRVVRERGRHESIKYITLLIKSISDQNWECLVNNKIVIYNFVKNDCYEIIND